MSTPIAGPRPGRPRTVLLVVLALAALTDLGTYVGLSAGSAGNGDERPATAGEVALEVVRAVADGDCSAVPDLVTDDADLPFTVRACLDGEPAGAALGAVRELDRTMQADTATVVLGVVADGAEAEVTAELRRDDGRWLVTAIR